MMIRKKAGAALTAALAMSLLAACGDDNAADETTDAGGETAATGEISIGVPAGWDEGVVVSHMAEIALEEQGYVHCRYADDFAILGRGAMHAQQSLDLVGDELARSGMAVNPSKTAVFATGDGFDFLGQRVLPPGRPTSADRHHHPVRAAFRTPSPGLAGYRSAPASADDQRLDPGFRQAAENLHPG